MREIKFRAWDKKFKEWACIGLKVGEGVSPIAIKDYVFMQFTGLLDKNGKEIYEGDIVKILEKLYSNIEFIGEVHITVDGILVFGAVEYGKMSNNWGLLSQFDCEVIGNICENMELLK